MLKHLSVFLLLLLAAPAAAAAADMVADCQQRDDPYLRIGGCSNAIDSGRWFGRDLAWANYNRGTAFSALGHAQRAIQDYSRTIDLDPRYTLAFNNRGSTYFDLGAFELAIADLDRAVALDPTLAIAFFNRGNAHAALHDNEAAIAAYDEAIRLDPDLTEAFYGRGYVRAALGAPEAAIADFDRALTVNPGHAAARDGRALAQNVLAWRLYKDGQPADGLPHVTDALAVLPEAPFVIETSALILAALGRLDEALEVFERAMDAGGAERVRAYQEALAGLGYKPGPEAGVYDASTRDAMRLCLEAGCRLAD